MKKSGQASNLDHLWSPWRLDYIIGPKDKTTCVFCRASGREAGSAPATEPDPLVVFQGTLAYVILNLYPYNNGHLMVVPYRHESSLAALGRDEMNEVGLLVQRCETALREAYRLEGINVGVNLGAPAGAGIEEHVHVHLVPRWNGDTNFMTVVGQTRVLPEDIGATAARLKPIFLRLAEGGDDRDRKQTG
jgi:ATP adenylyltransferase